MRAIITLLKFSLIAILWLIALGVYVLSSSASARVCENSYLLVFMCQVGFRISSTGSLWVSVLSICLSRSLAVSPV